MPTFPPGYLKANKGGQLIGVSVAMGLFGILVVIARFLAQRRRKAPLGADDYVIIPALICCIGLDIIGIAIVKQAGVGYHAAAVFTNPKIEARWAQYLTALEIIYGFAIAFAKCSILLLYYRIFISSRFRVAIYVLAFIVISWGLSDVFVAIFQCSPVRFAWDKAIQGSCINQLAFYRWISMPNIVTDIVMLSLPMPMVWKLHCSVAQRVGLSAIFLMGSVGLIASCVRLSIFFRHNAFLDPTWTSIDLIVWTLVEAGAILIAACLPTLRPLFVLLIPHRFSSRSSGPIDKNNSSLSSQRSWRASNRQRAPAPKGPFSRLDTVRGENQWSASNDIAGTSHEDRTWSDLEVDGVPLTDISVRRDLEWSSANRPSR